jgi:hypothetical protein
VQLAFRSTASQEVSGSRILERVRWALLVLLVAVPALARPRVAVAPLDGDDDKKISSIVAEAAVDHAKVTGPGRTGKALDELSITSFTGKSLKKLRSNLEVDVVIHGAVKKKHLSLTLSGKGKQKSTLELDFKTTKALRKQLAAQLGKKLDEADGGNDDDADDDDARKTPFGDSKKGGDDPPKKHADDEDRPKKHADDEDRPKKHADDEDRPRKHDDDKPRKHDDDDRHHARVAADDDSVRKHSDDDDDDRHGRKRRHHRDEPDRPRNPITQASLYLDAGGQYARRTLSYDYAPGMMNGPPGVGTAAPAASIEGEVYPGAFKPKSHGGGIGLFGACGYTFGLGIAVPGANITAPIKDGHYEIGARYRVAFGGSSIAFGASYWRRWYIADRGALTMGQMLDMPDVDYTAVAPGAVLRVPAAPKIGVVVAVDVPLMLNAGPVSKGTSYGPADVLAFDVLAGAQISLAPHYALLLRADFDQVGLSFKAKPQSGAATRGVSAATDRTIGLTASLDILY